MTHHPSIKSAAQGHKKANPIHQHTKTQWCVITTPPQNIHNQPLRVCYNYNTPPHDSILRIKKAPNFRFILKRFNQFTPKPTHIRENNVAPTTPTQTHVNKKNLSSSKTPFTNDKNTLTHYTWPLRYKKRAPQIQLFDCRRRRTTVWWTVHQCKFHASM